MRYGFYVSPSVQEVFGLAFIPETGKCVKFTDIVDIEQGEEVPAGVVDVVTSSFRLIIKAHHSRVWCNPVGLIQWSGEGEYNSDVLNGALEGIGLSVRTLTNKYSEQKISNAVKAAEGLLRSNGGVACGVVIRPSFIEGAGCSPITSSRACAL